jgi:site-specific DNA-methyltransferase (adenine-specific)
MKAMASMPDKCFDLAIVDPPYGIGMDGGNVGYKGFNNFEKKDWDKSPPSPEYFNELRRVSKEQIIWGSNNFSNLPPHRGFIVWDKGQGFKGRTYAECEFAYLSIDSNAKIYKRDPLAKRDYFNKKHPCQKPVQLYKWLLQNYAKPGDKILDTHLGSGSIALACWDLKFDLTGYEIDTDYFKAATERLEKHKAQGQLF